MKTGAFTKTYGERKVLDFPGYELEPGRLYAVIGANGSGKSTFARILTGLEKPDGKAAVLPEEQGLSVGFMPQKSYAFRMNTRKNILLNGGDRAKADTLMKALGLEKLASAGGHRLSGGETAKMALARLLMKPYGLLILDEPTASMDMESTIASEQLIREYCRREQAAVILITHSLQQARRIADEVLYFEKGRLAETGPAGKLLTEPEKEETKRFLRFYGAV